MGTKAKRLHTSTHVSQFTMHVLADGYRIRLVDLSDDEYDLYALHIGESPTHVVLFFDSLEDVRRFGQLINMTLPT